MIRSIHRLTVACALALLLGAVPHATPAFAQPPAAAAQHQLIVHEINVGQGAATLLEFPCAAVLVDAGGEGEADGPAVDHLITYLDAFFARRGDLNSQLAAVFITHTHKDHNIGLRRVAERYAVGGYIHNGVLRGSGSVNAQWMAGHVSAPGHVIPTDGLTEVQVHAAQHKGYTDDIVDPVKCDQVDPTIRVLSGSYPTRPAAWSAAEFQKNGNLQSLVIRVDFGQASMLFTGDLEDTAIATLLANFQGTHDLDVDVYHVGHHGSYNGTTADLLAALTPRMALIGMGDPTTHAAHTAWDYGHPRRKAVTWLDAAVSASRPEVNVRVFESVKFGHPELADHAVSSMFDLKHAIWGTGWDGDIDVIAMDNGTLSAHPAP